MTPGRINLDYLRDIEIAATECLEFIEGLDYEGFAVDRKRLAGVSQRIALTGEAANQISNDVKLFAPSVPWQEMVDMRNKLVHDYYEIRAETIWNTLQDGLPPLIKQVDRLLDDLAVDPS